VLLTPCVIVWFKSGLYISKAIDKKTHSIDIVKDYGKYVLPTLFICVIANIMFDLWMFKAGFDIGWEKYALMVT
jgi:hypothetical protein